MKKSKNLQACEECGDAILAKETHTCWAISTADRKIEWAWEPQNRLFRIRQNVLALAVALEAVLIACIILWK